MYTFLSSCCKQSDKIVDGYFVLHSILYCKASLELKLLYNKVLLIFFGLLFIHTV
jgi:hypothetical protein